MVWIPTLQHDSPFKGPDLRSFVKAGQSLDANGYIATTSVYRKKCRTDKETVHASEVIALALSLAEDIRCSADN